jgi:DNA-binding CsgD family transcriptional regulator
MPAESAAACASSACDAASSPPSLPETSGWAALTTSELTVARLVTEGLTNREVAERLFVSPHTVNSHLRHVFSKLGINSRVELARLARDYEMA